MTDNTTSNVEVLTNIMGVAGAWLQYIIIAMLHSVQRIVESHVPIQAPPTMGEGDRDQQLYKLSAIN